MTHSDKHEIKTSCAFTAHMTTVLLTIILVKHKKKKQPPTELQLRLTQAELITHKFYVFTSTLKNMNGCVRGAMFSE